MPRLYILAGPNGAGKTTAAKALLPHALDIREFVNADEIARGLSPFNPEGVALTAGRIMLARMRELVSKNEDFAFETTLATRSYVTLLKELKAKGYTIYLYFISLATVELAIRRVADRVAQGGHNIPEATIRRRFRAARKNLFELYLPLLDEWYLYDNSQNFLIPVATGFESTVDKILASDIWKQLQLRI